MGVVRTEEERQRERRSGGRGGNNGERLRKFLRREVLKFKFGKSVW